MPTVELPPAPRFTRTTHGVAKLEDVIVILDRCRGPVAVDDLHATEIVLQTCVSKTKLVLVGFEEYEPQIRL